MPQLYGIIEYDSYCRQIRILRLTLPPGYPIFYLFWPIVILRRLGKGHALSDGLSYLVERTNKLNGNEIRRK